MRRSCIVGWLLGLLLLSTGCGESALEFQVEFDHVDGLRTGDPVTYRGVRIGRTRNVLLDDEGSARVRVRIEPEHRHLVTTSCRFRLLPDPERGDQGGKLLAVRPGREPGQPLLPDARVRGETEAPWLDLTGLAETLTTLAEGAEEGLAHLSRKLEGFLVELDEMAEDQELQEFRRQMEEAARQAREAGREQWEEFQREVLPHLQGEAKRLAESLEEAGRGIDASRLMEQLQRLGERSFWLEEEPTPAPTAITL